MPREIVHWLVLERAKEALPARGASATAKTLNEFPAAAYLGAVAHDAPYYYRLGADASFNHVAESLHGRFGQDTFDPLRAMAADISMRPDNERAELWAFLLGMVSHYAADVIFHPMIFYFTGDYYDPDTKARKAARARHRLLEVYLDSWFHQHIQTWNSDLISTVLKSLGRSLTNIAALLEQNCGVDIVPEHIRNENAAEEKDEKWERSFWHMAKLQELFYSTPVGFVMRQVNTLSFGAFDEYDALCSYGRRRPLKFFEEPLSFENPIERTPITASITELLGSAVNDCTSLFLQFEPLISGSSTDIEEALGGIVGKSLSMGVKPIGPKVPRFFSSQGLPLPGLKIS